MRQIESKNIDVFLLDTAKKVMFCYYENSVVILSAFRKKTWKTPMNEIKKALSRKSKL